MLVAIALAAIATGVVAGWRLAGPMTKDTEIGRVSLELSPSLTGHAEAYIPLADWGFRADAFDAPFSIHTELRSLERPALTRAAEGDLSTLGATEDELERAARSIVLRDFAWGLGTTLFLLAVATLAWRSLRPRWLLFAVGGVLAVLMLAAAGLAARTTFDARAFQSPTYYAHGAELRRILEVAQDEAVDSRYGSTFGSILSSVSAILAEGPADEAPGRDLYLASDLHGNALVIRPLAQAIGDAPLLLAGDFGQRGGEVEAKLLAPRVAALGEGVVAVSGNHDSSGLMESLREAGVAVLDEDPESAPEPDAGVVSQGSIEIEGLVIAGYPDPLEWRGAGDPEDRPVTFEDLPDPGGAFQDATADLEAWFDSLPRRPDVVMVHQNALAQALAKSLDERGLGGLTIVTGHDHRQHVDRHGEIIVVDGGSVGAGGIFGAGEEPIGLARLHFAATTPELRSVDLIAIEPFSGQAQGSRIAIDAMCPDEESCRFEPAALETQPIGD